MRWLFGVAVARRYWALSSALLACPVLTLACSATGSPGLSSPRTNQIPSAPTPTKSAAELAGDQATQAYLGMWQAMAQAGETSDWQSPVLAQYATGDALTTITRGLYADHYNHVVSRGAPVDHPNVTTVDPPTDPATVRISDCGDSTNWLLYKEGTNQLADNSPGGRRAIVAEVKKQADGTWRVDQFAVEGLASC